MRPIINDTRGRVTAYGFACGHLERRDGFTLYREHGVYHVKGFDATGKHYWETARTVTEARKLLQRIGR